MEHPFPKLYVGGHLNQCLTKTTWLCCPIWPSPAMCDCWYFSHIKFRIQLPVLPATFQVLSGHTGLDASYHIGQGRWKVFPSVQRSYWTALRCYGEQDVPDSSGVCLRGSFPPSRHSVFLDIPQTSRTPSCFTSLSLLLAKGSIRVGG